jgi:ATP-dependent Clp protease adaptor protein ClpS
MSETHATTVDKTHLDFLKPKKYKVVLFNDDYTPMNFVIALLVEIFKKSVTVAEEITMQVHQEGKGVAGVYYYEIAEQKVAEATLISQANNFPLKLILEEE